MAKTDYGAEIRSAQAQATDKVVTGRKAGTTHTVGKTTPTPAKPQPSQTATQKSVNGSQDPMQHMPMMSASGAPHDMSGMGDMHRVSHAAGIAHAILGGRKMM